MTVSFSRFFTQIIFSKMPTTEQGPAGMSQKKSKEPRGRKPAGKNVQVFLAREVEIHNAKGYTKRNDLQAYKAQWEEGQIRRLSQNGKARKQQA